MSHNERGTIDIDIGGTFTDCVAYYGSQISFTKTPTTAYDLSVGFMRAIKDVSSAMGRSVEDLLKSTDVIRYSTTLAMNRLIERKGARLGLMTTEGFEDTLYLGRGGSWGDGISLREMRCLPRISKPEHVIPRHRVVGVKERVDFKGNVVRPLDEEDVFKKLRYLVNQGVQGFVVCLIHSYMNPAHEQRIRELIRMEYPEAYLGSMIVVLSSEVLPKRHEYSRMVASVLNAYLHTTMSDELAGMSDELRALGYKRPTMMVHNTGGMAEVFRSTVLNTYNGGPVAGLIGGAYIGKQQGFGNIIVTDMGGTSFDLGTIVEGSTRFYEYHPVIDRFAMDITLLESRSIGAGGGSIAWLNPTLGNRIEVGPQSAGSIPGPGCYNLGGTEPTVTDADLLLGYLNPDYFHGGKIRLDRAKSESTIREKIAEPLKIGVEEAALLIRKVVDGNMANTIYTETVLRGYDPKDFVLFAIGGAGPTHGCSYAFGAGVGKVMVFPYSPVFCALGSARMDIVQIYELSRHIPMIRPLTKEYFTDYEYFNDAVRQLQRQAIRDLEAQGFPVNEQSVFSLELDMRYGGQLNIKRINSPHLFIRDPQDVEAIYKGFEKEYSEAYSRLGVYPEGGVDIENFVLHSKVLRPKIELPEYPLKGSKPPKKAVKNKRAVFWEEMGKYIPTHVYEMEELEPGNVIDGPAIFEAKHTTVVLPPRRRYSINKYLTGIIE